MLGLFGAALAGSHSWPGWQHVVLASSRGKKNHFIAKAVTSQPSGHSSGQSVLGVEHDCRVTPEQGMPTSTEQTSHQSRAPGEHLHKKGKHQLLLESSPCFSLSPGSSTRW